MFSGLDDPGLILRNLDVLLLSVCDIFSNGPSGSLQHCGREEGERRRHPNSIVDAVVPEVCGTRALLEKKASAIAVAQELGVEDRL